MLVIGPLGTETSPCSLPTPADFKGLEGLLSAIPMTGPTALHDRRRGPTRSDRASRTAASAERFLRASRRTR